MVPGTIFRNGVFGLQVGNPQSTTLFPYTTLFRSGNGSTGSITVEKHLPSSGLPRKFYPGLQDETRLDRVKIHSSDTIVDCHVLGSLKMNRRIPRFAGGCIVDESRWIGWVSRYPHQ